MKTDSPKFVVAVTVVLVITILATAVGVGLLVNYRDQTSSAEFNTFASCDELLSRLTYDYRRTQPVLDGFGFDDAVDTPASPEDGGTTTGGNAGGGTDSDYSPTNVQVAGVDEADIVKTDGDNVYVISASKVLIFDASAPADLEPISEIVFGGTPEGMFISGDKLAIFGYGSRFYKYAGGAIGIETDYISPSRSQMVLQVYDVSDPASPQVERTISLDGNYNTARLVDGKVYLVARYYSDYYYNQVTNAEDVLEVLPFIADVQSEVIKEDDFVPMADCNEVSYYGNSGNSISMVVAIDLEDAGTRTNKVMVGGADTIFMSKNNLYLSTPVYPEVEQPPEPCSVIQRALGLCSMAGTMPVTYDYTKVETQIFRLGVDGLDVKFAAVGSVPGTLLNQFSMDENSGYLRVATTQEVGDRLRTTLNNLYVLNAEDMQQVGSVEDLAQGERIYAVRFIGQTAYVVTFRQVDPLFVIDLSNPQSPEVLGELKIPGFSDYLHPYDENHIIGFGKEADPSSGRTEGVKFALFDISDPTAPKQIHQIELGAAGSDSEVLRDHKALLFDREKGLMVVPITTTDAKYKQTFAGFKIFNVSVSDGFTEEAEVDATSSEEQYYYYTYGSRSLYVDDTLFLVGFGKVRTLSLEDFTNIADFELEDDYRYIYF